jgi:hypothetical protein
VSAQRPLVTLGRRIYRGFFFALVVGLAGAGLSVIPSLFVQSIFITEAQRCFTAQETDIAAAGEIQTTCADDFVDAPTWMPFMLVLGGGVFGLVGGFWYGFVAPKSAPRHARDREQTWLPF